VAPSARGHGLSRLLLEHALERAHADRSAVLRLETRADNARAQALFESCGFARIGRRDAYYEDGAAAVLYEKTLWDRSGATSTVALRCPFYAQTLDFTCGPCSLLMAMAALDPRTTIDRTSEIRLWRESTTVYLAAGHGGCGPFGLAAAALRRGFDVRVHAPPGEAMFIDSVRDPRKKEVIELVEADFRAEVLRCDRAQVSHSPVSAAGVVAHLAAGRIPIVLISLWRLHGERGPHWVVVTGFDGAVFRLLDPIATSSAQDPGIPVSLDEFRRITRYGKRRQTSAIILSKEA
jgi:predicted GNAT family acetyltransferase